MVEVEVQPRRVQIARLNRNCEDWRVYNNVGRERSGLYLAHLWQMLKLWRDQNLIYTVRGYSNVHYVFGVGGEVRTVNFHWDWDDGLDRYQWRIDSHFPCHEEWRGDPEARVIYGI
mgnify:CR=1 FL=1